eukprot:4233609-Heterocapsa_arctica.AAC.1
MTLSTAVLEAHGISRNSPGLSNTIHTMEEDAVYQIHWRRQLAEINYIAPSKDVIPTTDMEMKIK